MGNYGAVELGCYDVFTCGCFKFAVSLVGSGTLILILKVEELLTFYCHKYTPPNPNDILSVHPQGEVAECSAQYVTASQ